MPAGTLDPDPTLPYVSVTLGGREITVPRAEVRYAEATGDYARLVTRSAAHLVRIPIAELAERWADFGFVRVHRRWLVQLSAVSDVSSVDGRMRLRVGDAWLEVSRRRAAEVRTHLTHWNRSAIAGPPHPEPGTVR